MEVLDKYLLKFRFIYFISSLFLATYGSSALADSTSSKQTIKALYIPLADHYAALVAYDRYASQMKFADFQIEQMKNWDLLRAYFQSGDVDMAFVMSPLAMDMFIEKPHFRWIGLMHRDGNALAINDLINEQVNLAEKRTDRKPDDSVALTLKRLYLETGKSIEIAMPHLKATHSVVLYRYLKEHGVNISFTRYEEAPVTAISVAPPKSPSFIKAKSNRNQAAAFEQSLPWADIVETSGYGHVAWYSKDVMPWKNGHVECISLATDKAINEKNKAIKEVTRFIQKAGEDIEIARSEGGIKLESIVKIIRKYIPAHSREAIIASLDPELRVINYQHLNVDKAGLKQIMDLALEGGIIMKPVDIESFSDTQFDIKTIDK
ncbi:MAG: nitrate ABC transporter substrate-binding protein [endosymbiont of Galathealinum brachiosum]|uniref:Nitrate ABC transporter substrate-binding protein n=1 Tax=endosymbiont of Galathealinum brachiosum TaxID=2200906 RepID=A0A370DME0_9GAMM|nr:MAG: nitrate ABC transporter substrate-binding protein [endosymbiont of Galathealinum brachiosum]